MASVLEQEVELRTRGMSDVLVIAKAASIQQAYVISVREELLIARDTAALLGT